MSEQRLLLELPEPWYQFTRSEAELREYQFQLDPFSSRLSAVRPSSCAVWDIEECALVGSSQRAPSDGRIRYPLHKITCRPGMDLAVLHSQGRSSVEILRADTFKRSHFLKGPQSHLQAVALSPCDQIVAAVDMDQLYLWHITEPDPVDTASAFSIHESSHCNQIEFSPDGRFLVCYSSLGSSGVWIWDMTQRSWKRPPLYLQMLLTPLRLAMTADSRALLISARQGMPEYDSPFQAIDDTQTWRVDLETGELSVVNQTYEDALGLDVWTRGAPSSLHEVSRESGFWNLYYRDQRVVQLPSAIYFAALTHDQRWLVVCSQGALYRILTDSLWDTAITPEELGSSLHNIALMLRSAVLAPGDAMDLLEPRELLLRWFAVECATYGLLQAERKGRLHVSGQREDAQRGEALLKQCQQFALDSLSPEEQEEGKEIARGLSRLDDETQQALYGAIGARRAINAVRASRKAAPESWRRHRLAFLCELWATCGDRAPWLLWEGKCPLEVPDEASFDLAEADDGA